MKILQFLNTLLLAGILASVILILLETRKPISLRRAEPISVEIDPSSQPVEVEIQRWTSASAPRARLLRSFDNSAVEHVFRRDNDWIAKSARARFALSTQTAKSIAWFHSVKRIGKMWQSR